MKTKCKMTGYSAGKWHCETHDVFIPGMAGRGCPETCRRSSDSDEAVKDVVISTIRVRAYDVISRAVEEGIACGYRRAHKYLGDGEHPNEENLKAEIEQAILNEICDVLDFDRE